MGSRSKDTLRNLATLTAGILVAIGIAEGALRLSVSGPRLSPGIPACMRRMRCAPQQNTRLTEQTSGSSLCVILSHE